MKKIGIIVAVVIIAVIVCKFNVEGRNPICDKTGGI